MTESVLVGDIGGTTTRFAVDDGELRVVAQHPTANAPDLRTAVAPVLASLSAVPAGVAVAVAGPVRDGRATLTNAKWTADVRSLPSPGVLLNDLEAAAHGVGVVPADRVRTVGGEAPVSEGRRVVLGIGTGHGQAIWTDRTALSGEGGHADFASTDPVLDPLVAYLRGRHGRVSIEDVVSGTACEGLLSFVSEQMGPAATKMWRDHPAAAVIDAHADTDPGCAKALDLFIRALGAVAGDAALRILPTGGVWIVGGVAGRLLRPNGDAALRMAFEAKGRMSSAVAALPIVVVDDPEIVLRGAVVVARAAMH